MAHLPNLKFGYILRSLSFSELKIEIKSDQSQITFLKYNENPFFLLFLTGSKYSEFFLSKNTIF